MTFKEELVKKMEEHGLKEYENVFTAGKMKNLLELFENPPKKNEERTEWLGRIATKVWVNKFKISDAKKFLSKTNCDISVEELEKSKNYLQFRFLKTGENIYVSYDENAERNYKEMLVVIYGKLIKEHGKEHDEVKEAAYYLGDAIEKGTPLKQIRKNAYLTKEKIEKIEFKELYEDIARVCVNSFKRETAKLKSEYRIEKIQRISNADKAIKKMEKEFGIERDFEAARLFNLIDKKEELVDNRITNDWYVMNGPFSIIDINKFEKKMLAGEKTGFPEEAEEFLYVELGEKQNGKDVMRLGWDSSVGIVNTLEGEKISMCIDPEYKITRLFNEEQAKKKALQAILERVEAFNDISTEKIVKNYVNLLIGVLSQWVYLLEKEIV